MAKGLLTLLLSADTKGFNRSMNTAGKKLTEVERRAQRVRNTLKAVGWAAAGIVIADMTRRVVAFDKAMVGLSAILRTSRKDIKALEDQAVSLGGTTIFTATQVGELQTVLARFGFVEQEILGATEAILDFAAAAGVDTASAAQLAAGTMRAFGIEADDMTRVVDVLTNALTKSALDFGSLSQAMVYAAPLAKATGVSLEELAGVMGILADNNIKGSIAGTSMRRILTELGRVGLSLSDIFTASAEKIAEVGNALAYAKDETGQYALSSFLVLTENAELIDKNTKAMQSFGDAHDVAGTQMESLANKFILLESAWEGFIIKVENGEGRFGKTIGLMLEKSAELLNYFADNEPDSFEVKLLKARNGGQLPEPDKDAHAIESLAPRKNALGVVIDYILGSEASPEWEKAVAKRQAEQLKEAEQDYKDSFAGPGLAEWQEFEALIKSINALQAEMDAIAAEREAIEKPKRDAAKRALDKFNKEQAKYAEEYGKQLDEQLGIISQTVIRLDEMTGIYSKHNELIGFKNSLLDKDGNMKLMDDSDLPQFRDANLDAMVKAKNDEIAINEARAESYQKAGQQIGAALSQGAEDWEAYGSNLGDTVLDLITQYALLAASAATANAVESGAASGPYGFLAIPALVGLALGLVKTGMNSAKSTAKGAFAEGGLVSGPTQALVGEYSGASRDPEVIAPLSKLMPMLQKSGMSGATHVTGEFVLKNKTLVAAVKRETERLNKYGG